MTKSFPFVSHAKPDPEVFPLLHSITNGLLMVILRVATPGELYPLDAFQAFVISE
jgi:hypothetical protein